MAGNVYFSSLDNKKFKSPLDKITRLIDKCEISKIFKKGEIIAVKVHFGELGNTSFLRPVYLRPVIDSLKKLGAKPFIGDTNTLYVGMRTNSVDHLHNAAMNGFNYSTLQTPVIIADGLRGENSIDFEVNLPLSKYVKLASDFVHADGMVVVSHFKAHEMSLIGGAIKNVAMGCASRQGKMDMHSNARPKVTAKKCTKCSRCISSCQVEAIEMRDKAFITEKCVGCVRCVAVCPEQAITVNMNNTTDILQKKMVEYVYGMKKALDSKIIFINILTQMSPACDCYGGNDKPMSPDIGFLSSTDPVALDKASYDLVLKTAGEDVFKKVYPDLDTKFQFEHAEEIGLGTTDYKLINVD
jgi:uncharacterized protein